MVVVRVVDVAPLLQEDARLIRLIGLVAVHRPRIESNEPENQRKQRDAQEQRQVAGVPVIGPGRIAQVMYPRFDRSETKGPVLPTPRAFRRPRLPHSG